MSNDSKKSAPGRVYDPVFIMMLVAVTLAIGSSFALRNVATGFGPSSAHASNVSPDTTADLEESDGSDGSLPSVIPAGLAPPTTRPRTAETMPVH